MSKGAPYWLQWGLESINLLHENRTSRSRRSGSPVRGATWSSIPFFNSFNSLSASLQPGPLSPRPPSRRNSHLSAKAFRYIPELRLRILNHATVTVLGNQRSITAENLYVLIEGNHAHFRTSTTTELGRRGRMVSRNNVVPTVHLFIQATRVGIALRPPPHAEARLYQVAAVEANLHSEHQPQVRTHRPWARDEMVLLRLGRTT